MTLLTTWPDTDPGTVLVGTADPEEIRRRLGDLGVRFTRWDVVDLPATATNDDVLAAYADEIAAVSGAEGYTLVDAVALTPGDDPGWEATAAGARQKFLAEHTHADDEDRFFARGAGVFYLHIDDRVHAVLCEAGDLLSVPARTTHWFDMGTRPDFIAVRFFHDGEGWVGDFTGDDIATRFPDFDTLAAHRPTPA